MDARSAMNSITVLVVHTTGTLRYWLGELLGGEAAHRDRETEIFRTWIVQDAFARLLNETQAQISRVLEKIVPEDLAAKHYSTIHKDYFTGAYALAHAVEHTALHLGHMEITRRNYGSSLLGQERLDINLSTRSRCLKFSPD